MLKNYLTSCLENLRVLNTSNITSTSLNRGTLLHMEFRATSDFTVVIGIRWYGSSNSSLVTGFLLKFELRSIRQHLTHSSSVSVGCIILLSPIVLH
jgi:hypothetical protein